MGIFRQFPYSNFHEMNLDILLNDMKDLSSEVDVLNQNWVDFIENWETELHSEINDEIENYLSENPGWVTPELYGAVGDGVTDDSHAISEAIASGNVVFFPKKTYRVDNTITIGEGIYICGNYATLTGNANPILKIQTYFDEANQRHNSLPVIVEKFNIIGNEANIAIDVDKATKVKISDMNIRQFLTGILFRGGYENIFTNCRFIGSETNQNTIGVWILSGGDSVFEHLMGKDVVTGIEVNSGHNLFYDIHFWINSAVLYQGSRMIYDTSAGGPTNIFNDIYFDTYQKCYYKTGLASAIFNNPRCLCSANVAPTDDSVLFYIDNADFISTYNGNVRFNNVITSRGNTTRCIHGSNETTMPLFLTFMPTNNVQRDRFWECNLVKDLDIRRLSRVESISLNSGYSITSGYLYKKDKHIFGDLTIVCDNPLTTNTPQTIGNLLYAPDITTNSYCCTGSSEWNSEHLAYLYITGNIIVKPYYADTCIKAHIDYVMA